jgi:hypothetical protein
MFARFFASGGIFAREGSVARRGNMFIAESIIGHGRISRVNGREVKARADVLVV